jgi:tRNA (adenine22-N1)-methyltransferase
LDTRLACIASEVPACNLAADIGTDHGKLPCWLLASGRVKKMIVSDISKISRDKARDLFLEYEVTARVVLSGANGLFALQDNPEAVVIAGMGGGLVSEILLQDVALNNAKLILSAHTELPLLRDAVLSKGYKIIKELLVFSGGRYYRIITALPGSQNLSEFQRELGFNLHGTPGAKLDNYFRWQMEVAQTWHGEKGRKYRTILQEALDEQQSNNCSNDS